MIALVAIFGKQNEPIIHKNYLCDYLARQVGERHKLMQARQQTDATTINESSELGVESQPIDFQLIRQKRLLEVESTRMQMAMIAYSTLDCFDEK